MLISFLTNQNQFWKDIYQICTTVDACVKTVPISEPKIRKKHVFSEDLYHDIENIIWVSSRQAPKPYTYEELCALLYLSL